MIGTVLNRVGTTGDKGLSMVDALFGIGKNLGEAGENRSASVKRTMNMEDIGKELRKMRELKEEFGDEEGFLEKYKEMCNEAS